MTSARIDRLLMGLGALLILISSYQLFFSRSDSNVGEKLATLKSTLSVVKTKSALALDWRDASSGNDLSENQLVYTDNASSAEVVFTEGSTLVIGENSLIKLRASGKEQSMDLSKGFIRAKLDGERPLKVQMNGEEYLVSGDNADVQINLQDKQGEIGVISGEVNVVSDGLNEKLTPASALEISGAEVKKKLINLKASQPSQGEIRYVLETPSGVGFHWEPKVDARVLVSKHISLKNPEVVNGAPGVQASLGEGLYYYRLENESGSSLIHSFRLIKEISPELLRPIDGASVDIVEGQGRDVLLQWKGQHTSDYLLQWDDGSTHELKVRGSRHLIPVSSNQSFRWRIRIEDVKRPLAQWSEWQNVSVNYINVPSVPSDLAPHGVEYQTYEKPNEIIELTWKSDSKVVIEIRDPSGKVIQERPATSAHSITATQGGVYSWRAKAQDSYLRKSDWSEWKTFTIEDLSGEVAENKVQRIQLKKPDQTVTFNWQRPEGTTSVFELSKNKDFSEIVKRTETSDELIKVSIPVVGTYYWRSRSFLPDGTVNASEPKRVIIEPVPALIKPEKLPDIVVPLEEALPKSTKWSPLDLLFPKAWADDSRGKVKIELPSKEEGKAFVIRIFRDKELSNLVFEKTITEKVFEWNEAEAGVFYWQYAVIDYWDRKSLFSDPSLLTVTHEQVAEAEKVRLLSPIRAQEIDPKGRASFMFSKASLAVQYRVELSDSKDFKKIITTQKSKTETVELNSADLPAGLYFWRVFSINKKGRETKSNTGRFTIPSPREKTIIADFPREFQKPWRQRAFISWNPSLDTYSFKDGETGEISGTALMGVSLSGTKFFEHYILNGELLRQTGKVFEGEFYLFQRASVDVIKSWELNQNHKWGVGLAVGQVRGQSYVIGEEAVTSKALSGLSYGPVLRDYLSFNERWECQSKLLYLLGEVKQIELGGDVIRHWRDYLFSAGVSFATRDYETNSGKQTSLRLSLGLGKEF